MASEASSSWQRTGKNIPRSFYLKQYIPRYQPTGAALWGVTAFTAALFVVQPFDWIDKNFIHPPPPEAQEDEGGPPAAQG